MSAAVHVLTASRALAPHRERLHEICRAAIGRIGRSLPVHDVDIVLQHHPTATLPRLGIGGYAPTAHLVQVSLDPHVERFGRKLERHLPRVLAHELHHCARWRGPGYGRTLGEALVTEGLADHFDLEVHAGEPYPWARALDDAQLQTWWARARSVLWREGYDHARWFFHRDQDGPPLHTGYALGFRLVERYLRQHPDQRPSTLVLTPAPAIVHGSGMLDG